MSRSWEKFFFIGSFLTQGSSYISPYAYGMMHRLHHMHTDTENDPHSPGNYQSFWRMMLETRNNYFSIYSGKTAVDEKLKNDLPKWKAFDSIAHNWFTRTGWMIVYTLFYIAFATAWWQYLFLPVTIIMITFQGAVVNWWAHKFGYVNYPVKNTSKNIIPVDLFFMGEAYHNNHHKYPGRPNNAHRWFEFDPGYLVLKLMHKTGIIRLNKYKMQ